MGMYHCPYCLMMLLAGGKHPTCSENDLSCASLQALEDLEDSEDSEGQK